MQLPELMCFDILTQTYSCSQKEADACCKVIGHNKRDKGSVEETHLILSKKQNGNNTMTYQSDCTYKGSSVNYMFVNIVTRHIL